MPGSCGLRLEFCDADLVLHSVPGVGDVGVGMQSNPFAKPFLLQEAKFAGCADRLT